MNIEIDSSIVASEQLLERIKNSAMEKNIPAQYYSESAKNGGESEGFSIEQIKSDMAMAYQNLQMMNVTWEIHEMPIISNRPVLGKVIMFLKKAFRKCTRWLFQTYYEQQTRYNGAATRTISDMIRVQQNMIILLEQMEKERGEHYES